jgi:hypothetical protein
MCASKGRAYPSEAPQGALPYNKLLALPIDIRQHWKGLTGRNIPAYYEHTYLEAGVFVPG